jgi:uncharacterized repeat protein (TIGR01451 family)
MKYKNIFILIISLFITSLWADGTLAGTQIKNQASATYKDASGTALNSTSNEVITTVAPKYAFTVTPDGTVVGPPGPGQTQNATVGNTVYFPYVLKNSSNTSETFTLTEIIVDVTSNFTPTNVKVYKDENGNGIVDPGDAEVAIDGSGKFGPVGTDALFHFIVAYDVPVDAVAGEFAIVSPAVKSDSDAALLIDNENYNKTTVISGAVVTANITVSPTSSVGGAVVAYSITGSNTGNSDAYSKPNIGEIDGISKDGILVSNELPKDGNGNYLTINGTPTGSGPTGSVVVYSSDGLTWTTTLDPNATYIGLFMPDSTVDSLSTKVLAPGQSYELKYNLTIPIDAPAGVISDYAIVYYRSNATTDENVTTNIVNLTISATANSKVQVGTKSDPLDDTFVDGENLVLSAAAGSTVVFYNAVKNADDVDNPGSGDDVFNLTYDKSDLPAGSSVQFYYADGVTPLTDTNNDGFIDVGLTAPGNITQFVVKVFLPGTATDAGAEHNLIITATSSNDNSVNDTTTDRINQITRPGVDIGNRDGATGTTDDNPDTITGTPGSFVDFPLDVINDGQASDTFNLTTTGLPAGWTATYYEDKNNNGVLDPDELTPITNITLPAWDGTGTKPEKNIIARIDIPAGEGPQTPNISFTTTSNLDPSVIDTITNIVEIQTIAGVDFTPDRNGTGVPGGTVTYVHLLRNTGNTTDLYTLNYTSSENWTYVFYNDAGDVINDITLAANASANITVKGFLPTNAAVNTNDIYIATATSANDPSVEDTVTDTTVVIAGVLQLNKAVDKANAKPGEEIEYSIDYKNLSTGNLTDLVITDPIPQYTFYVSHTASVGPGGALTIEASVDGSTWNTTFNADIKFIRWRGFGTITAGLDSSANANYTLKFKVQIK